MKRVLSVLLLCALLAALPVTALASDFNAGLTIDRETEGEIAVTVHDSDVLASLKPTLSIQCAFEKAYVSFGGRVIASVLEDGYIRFTVASGGVYTIREGDAPAPVIPPVIPEPEPEDEPLTPENCTHDDSCPVGTFTDTAPDAWYHDGVHYALSAGLMLGRTADTFVPAGRVTRQQVWMVLARLAGETPETMADARAWAVASGITDGTDPGSAVTRQQLVAMLWRYAKLSGLDTGTADSAALSDYSDAQEIRGYAAEPFAWACAAGLIQGKDGCLKPGDNASRAQLAVILYRLSGLE